MDKEKCNVSITYCWWRHNKNNRMLLIEIVTWATLWYWWVLTSACPVLLASAASRGFFFRADSYTSTALSGYKHQMSSTHSHQCLLLQSVHWPRYLSAASNVTAHPADRQDKTLTEMQPLKTKIMRCKWIRQWWWWWCGMTQCALKSRLEASLA